MYPALINLICAKTLLLDLAISVSLTAGKASIKMSDEIAKSLSIDVLKYRVTNLKVIIMNTVNFKKMAYIATLIMATTLGSSSNANASYFGNAWTFWSGWVPTPIEVKSNGLEYTETVLPSAKVINIGIDLNISSGIFSGVMNWEVWPVTVSYYMPNKAHNSFSHSYPLGARPIEVDLHIHPVIDYKNTAVEQCNAMADDLRGQGYTDQEIFSIDRVVKIGVISRLEYQLVGLIGSVIAEGDEDVFATSFDLICKEYPGPQRNPNDDPEEEFDVQELEMFLSTFSDAVSNPEPDVECKKGRVLLRAKTNQAGPVEFHLWTQVGAEPMQDEYIPAMASHIGSGNYEAQAVRWLTTTETADMQALVEVDDGFVGLTDGWVSLLLECIAKSPGFTVGEEPDDDSGSRTSIGDKTF